MVPTILIAAVYVRPSDSAWIIGRQSGSLPWSSKQVPGELAFFRRMTTPGAVCFGRNTLKSNQALWRLPERRTYAFTRDLSLIVGSNDLYVGSLDDVERLEIGQNRPIFVAGGAELYESLMSRCQFACISYVEPADFTLPDEPLVVFPKTTFQKYFVNSGREIESTKTFKSYMYAR